jgi:hypothetical protein
MKCSDPDYKKIAFKHGVSPKEVEDIYKSTFKYIYEHVSKFDFDNMTEEEFNKKRTSFSLPPLGKLYTTFDHLSRVRKHLEYARNKYKESKTVVHEDTADEE